jgi:hypothetical protein
VTYGNVQIKCYQNQPDLSFINHCNSIGGRLDKHTYIADKDTIVFQNPSIALSRSREPRIRPLGSVVLTT